MGDAADSGGSDWEVVSLTASTYAAAPGPIPVSPIHKAESPLLLVPNPPAPPAHFFMSQHFNLPSRQPNFGTHLENSNGSQELESDPAVPDGDAADADDINMPICPENYREGERDGVLVLASPAGNGLQVEGGGGDEVQQTTTGICSLPDATAGSDHIPAAADATATLPAPAPAATVPVAAPSGGVAGNAAQAWWEKTYSFPRQDGNGGTEPLAFRFVFVAGKLQLQEDHLSGPVPEFGQTQKISCAGNEPLGQVKVSMLDGGSPLSQQG